LTPSRFCPKCGSTDKRLFKGFCVECYVADHPDLVSLPAQMGVEMCPQCLRFLMQKGWIPGTDEAIAALIRSKMKTSIENPIIRVERTGEEGEVQHYLMHVEGVVGCDRVAIERDVPVRVTKKQCVICARKDSTYHEALVQLRSKGYGIDLEKLKDALDFLRNQNRAFASKHREAEVFKFERVRDGINVYFGSLQAARRSLQLLAKKTGCKIKESYTLIGLDRVSSKKRYAVTISVRL
jgi:nonsense-mediated mRNA decay protein 3